MNFECSVCKSVYEDIEGLRHHYRSHRFNKLFFCNIQGCNLSFKKYLSFDIHLKHTHSDATVCSTVYSKYRCTAKDCIFSHDCFNMISRHLRDHLSQGVSVCCPISDCREEVLHTKNSLTIHNMYKHRNLTKSVDNLQEPTDTLNYVEDTSSDDILQDSLQNSYDSPQHLSVENATKSVGILLLKLLAKHHVPSIAVQQVVDCLSEISSLQEAHNHDTLNIFSSKIELSENESNDLFRNLVLDNFNYTLFNSTNGSFRSEYIRKQYFKNNFKYVEPIKVDLGINNLRKECFYYYVPIIETIKSVLNSYRNYQAVFSATYKNDGFMRDYTYGEKYKEDAFCQQDNVLHILLYQDGFGTVNPLGDAKSRHKIVGVYFTIGNMHSSLRATTENGFLAMLCLEKDFNEFGTHRIFEALITDIKQLETDGITLCYNDNEVILKGTIFSILGDNLGTHQIAGLSENFSNETYFSRYCYITKQQFKLYPFEKCSLRNQAQYEIDLSAMERDNSPYHGIKKSTIFNDLDYFSLFDFGMPPCYGHDLFLGCFNYDLVLILDSMVKKRLVGEKYLKSRINYLLKKLKLNSQITLNLKKKCITSKAVDLWHMIQILPFLFLKKQIVYAEDTFVLMMLLKQVTDLVTAPVISNRQIATLKLAINHYLQLRKSLFQVPLRPKHHYLCHYPFLIQKFGPLYVYSTMTGERKHSFFKNALRHAGNYKNVLKLCSERHQYWQALLSNDENRFKTKLTIDNGFCSYNDLNQDEKLLVQNFEFTDPCFKYTDTLSYNGTVYKATDCVFLETDDYDDFFVMKIKGFIFHEKSLKVSFYGEKLKVNQVFDLGLHIIDNSYSETSYICRDFDSLTDTTPMLLYVCDGRTFVFNRHAIPMK